MLSVPHRAASHTAERTDMGVFAKIKSAMRIAPAETADQPRTEGPRDLGTGRLLAKSVAPKEPVAIDLSHMDHAHDAPASPGDSTIDFDAELDGTDEKRLSAKKAKQELITELQKNYKEVLELVRRVQTHLDDQETRSTRLMEIAERIPAALDHLPEHREQNERLISAVDRLTDTANNNHDVSQQSLRELAKVNEQMSQSAHADRDLLTTMGEFKDAAEGIAENNNRAATAVKELAGSASKRDKELADAIAEGRKWMVIGVTVTAKAPHSLSSSQRLHSRPDPRRRLFHLRGKIIAHRLIKQRNRPRAVPRQLRRAAS